ncbi:hypothetical protein C8R46DRAFT_1227601 [Mycena filopes]|nr:hypothetical protein C8R46DRAFT_1227601 [Mycena filopes]
MNENTAPKELVDIQDPARMLISPPPEEELNRTRMLKPNNNQPKRKRGGTPSKQPSNEPVELTPNPKPRKAHRRRTSSQLAQQDSPTRPQFSRNPNADWVPRSSSVTSSVGRRSITPYEPPTDVFTPPREILLSTPVPAPKSSRPKPKPAARVTPQPHARTTTPLRVVVHSVKKEPLPAIDLDRPMTPPSPTDDPLLLLPSSSPVKRRPNGYEEPSSDAAYAPIDWTAGLDIVHDDDRSSDSMDLDAPASFDGPLPVSFVGGVGGEWDSDDDDADDGLPLAPAFSAAPAPPPQTTTTAATDSHPIMSFISTLPRPIPAPPTTRTTTTTTPPSYTYTTLVQPTKPDPPTPRTLARAEAWGVWGSPFPGRGEAGDGSFRMDGRKRGAEATTMSFTLAGADPTTMDASPQDAEEQHGEQEEDEDSDDMDEGVSFLRALREEDAKKREARRASSVFGPGAGVNANRVRSRLGYEEPEQEQQEEEPEEDEDEDEDEQEEAEVRAMSVDPEPEPEHEEEQDHDQQPAQEQELQIQQEEGRRFVVRTPTPAFDFGSSANETPARAPSRTQGVQTPPARWAGAAPVRSELRGFGGSEGAESRVQEQAHQDGHDDAMEEQQQEQEQGLEGEEKRVYTALGTRPPHTLHASPSKERLRLGGSATEHVHRARSRARASFAAVDFEAERDSAAVAQQERDSAVAEQQAEEADTSAEAAPEPEPDSDEEDAALLGLVKITSADPRAAARAAAILKQHDYDCFTRLRHSSRDKRRHSFAGVSKTSPSASSPQRGQKNIFGSRMQDIAVLRAQAATSTSNSKFDFSSSSVSAAKDKDKKARRQSARVVGERVYFPGSPAPVTTAQLLAEAEREVGSSASAVRSPSRVADAGESASTRTTPRRVPLPESEPEEEEEEESSSRPWGKPEWKALDACFTDERIAVAERLGMVLNLSPAPGPFSTPIRPSATTSNASGSSAVMMAAADAVDLGAVVARFVDARGGERVVAKWGPGWDLDSLRQRAKALQNKQRAGHVAPPTPNSSASAAIAFPSRGEDGGDVFSGARRQASMVVPDFTPLGKRAMPPRVSSLRRSDNAVAGSSNLLAGRARLPAPVLAGPFSQLPPTPEPLRKRRVPGSLFAPRYSHLLDEAVAVSRKGKEKAVEVEVEVEVEVAQMDDGEPEEEEESFEQEQQGQEQDESFSTDLDSSLDVDAEMAPATPLREREEAALYPQPAATAAPASMGRRVKGFLFSYLPTLAKTAPAPRTAALLARPRLPLPPLELLEKQRGPIVTPARRPLPKTRAPKELVSLQPAPAPVKKTGIPRRAPPQRMVELNHVEIQPEVRVGPRPRTSSGGSVKDLVKNFEKLDKEKAKGAEVKRVRSVGDFGRNNKNGAAGAGRPTWKP